MTLTSFAPPYLLSKLPGLGLLMEMPVPYTPLFLRAHTLSSASFVPEGRVNAKPADRAGRADKQDEAGAERQVQARLMKLSPEDSERIWGPGTTEYSLKLCPEIRPLWCGAGLPANSTCAPAKKALGNPPCEGTIKESII